MTIPDAPTGVTAVAGDGSAAVSWAEVDATPAVTGYTVNPYDANWVALPVVTVTFPTDTATVTGLTNGAAFTFTVTATNPEGTSPQSLLSGAVTPTTGAPPVTATCGTCSFWNPTSDPLLGQCRVNSPIPLLLVEWTPGQAIPMGIPVAWPLVESTDWCKEFES